MKLKDIIKEIAKNKDQFNKLNESKPNPKLKALVEDIVNQYLTEVNEGTLNLKKIDDKELASTYRYLIKQAVDDLDSSYQFEFDNDMKNKISVWLAGYTSMLINQLGKRDVSPAGMTPRY